MTGGLAARLEVSQGSFALSAEFSVPPGEVLGVLGPNGAGKTTILRILAGLRALDDGYISLDGQVLDDASTFVPAPRRPVGYVFQNYRLFPHLSVLDNVAFGLRMDGRPRSAARTDARRWLDRLDLSELAGRRPSQLSGGQQQRVALARALAAEPGLLLLDEPLAALDARTRLEVRAELRRHLHDFTGATVLVTHDPLEAMVMTDRLVVIEAGRIVQQGRPGDVARRPATQYVARLVGLNLYPGRPVPDRPGLVDLDDGGRLFTAAPEVTAPRLLLAVRPNSITVHTQVPGGASVRNVWPGTVRGLELLTDRVRVDVDGAPPALVDVTADAVAELGLVEGSAVWLSAKATDIDAYAHPD